jgi:hypothetical protein
MYPAERLSKKGARRHRRLPTQSREKSPPFPVLPRPVKPCALLVLGKHTTVQGVLCNRWLLRELRVLLAKVTHSRPPHAELIVGVLSCLEGAWLYRLFRGTGLGGVPQKAPGTPGYAKKAHPFPHYRHGGWGMTGKDQRTKARASGKSHSERILNEVNLRALCEFPERPRFRR